MKLPESPPSPTGRAPEPETARVSARVFELLESIEALPPRACGELVIEQEGVARGAIFVDNGRVCWAAAKGLSQRLSDLLRSHARSPITNPEMDALFRHGRANKKPLGELLVESKLMDPSSLLCALRRHSAESLIELAKLSVEAEWIERAPGMYKPMFTLHPVELTTCVGMLLDDRPPCGASPLADEGITWGAAFARRNDVILPIAATGVATVSELRRLGAEVAMKMEVSAQLDKASSFVFIGGANAHGRLAWREDPLIFVRRIEDRAELIRSLERLARRSSAETRGGMPRRNRCTIG